MRSAYPEYWAGCSRDLFRTEESICMLCEAELPLTNFHDIENNPVEKALYGRFQYQAATAFLYFLPCKYKLPRLK